MREKATSILLPGHFDHMLGRKKLDTEIPSTCIALEVQCLQGLSNQYGHAAVRGIFAGPWFFCELHDGVITGLKLLHVR